MYTRVFTDWLFARNDPCYVSSNCVNQVYVHFIMVISELIHHGIT